MSEEEKVERHMVDETESTEVTTGDGETEDESDSTDDSE
jgi:hypothetical protein